MRAGTLLLVGLAASAACVSKPARPSVEVDAAPTIEPDAAPDAPPDAIDLCEPDTCAAAGGTCETGTCVIVLTTAFVTCPPAMPCRVECLGKDRCKQGVSCGGATACTVRCEGEAACQDRGVDCAYADVCEVACIGTNACEHHPSAAAPHSVECREADCTVTCSGTGACKDGIGVLAGGTCAGSCCAGACEGDTSTCTLDPTCP